MILCRTGLGVVLSCVMWAQVAATPVVPVRSPLEEYSTTIERLVQIQTERYGPREEGGMGSGASLTRQSALGTEVFVSADGDIITNAHVVEEAWKIEVRLHGRGEARAQMIAVEFVDGAGDGESKGAGELGEHEGGECGGIADFYANGCVDQPRK